MWYLLAEQQLQKQQMVKQECNCRDTNAIMQNVYTATRHTASHSRLTNCNSVWHSHCKLLPDILPHTQDLLPVTVSDTDTDTDILPHTQDLLPVTVSDTDTDILPHTQDLLPVTVSHYLSPTIFSSRQFVARLLVQGCFRWPGQLFGTVCPLTLLRLTVCQFFVIVLKIICSLIRIPALFNNCTIFYRGLDAFYIALVYVNPIRNYYYYYTHCKLLHA